MDEADSPFLDHALFPALRLAAAALTSKLRAILSHAAVTVTRIELHADRAWEKCGAAAAAAALNEGAAVEAFGAAARAAIEGGVRLPSARWAQLAGAGGSAVPALLLAPAAGGAPAAGSGEGEAAAGGAPELASSAALSRTPLLQRGDLAPVDAPAGLLSISLLRANAAPWLIASLSSALTHAARAHALRLDAEASAPSPLLPIEEFVHVLSRAAAACGEGGGGGVLGGSGACCVACIRKPHAGS